VQKLTPGHTPQVLDTMGSSSPLSGDAASGETVAVAVVPRVPLVAASEGMQVAAPRDEGPTARVAVPKISLVDALCGETFDKLMLCLDGIGTARLRGTCRDLNTLTSSQAFILKKSTLQGLCSVSVLGQ
jgi:hypothetical protein